MNCAAFPAMGSRSGCARRGRKFLPQINLRIIGIRALPSAAPIVAGSAAALWALDPELSAPQVYELLTENTVGYGVAGEKQEGIYPMVNVGRRLKNCWKKKI